MTAFRVAFYKGIHSGVPGLYNRLVKAQDCGPYSHVEMQFSNGLSASSSFMDGGVRFKQIEYDSGNWDFIYLPIEWEAEARKWFEDHAGEGYDIWGNVHLALGFFTEDRDRKFCSEAVAGALRIKQAWRLTPNALYVVIERLCIDHMIMNSNNLLHLCGESKKAI